MKEKISEREIGCYTGGTMTRTGEKPWLVYEMEIVKAELRGPKWARSIRLTTTADQPTGAKVRVTVSIPLRTVQIVRVSDGRLRINGKRYGNRPLFLWPNPDRCEEATAYASSR